jgi:hypothetical protein
MSVKLLSKLGSGEKGRIVKIRYIRPGEESNHRNGSYSRSFALQGIGEKYRCREPLSTCGQSPISMK